MTRLFSHIRNIIIAVGAVFLTLGTAFLRGKSAGKAQQEAKQNEQILQSAQEAKKRQDSYDAMPIDVKRKRLHERWTKR
jgi:hypothetical protein